jgi:hypothetical protein
MFTGDLDIDSLNSQALKPFAPRVAEQYNKSNSEIYILKKSSWLQPPPLAGYIAMWSYG